MKKLLLTLLVVPFLGGCWGKKETPVEATTDVSMPTSDETVSSTVSTESAEEPEAMAEDEK